MQHKKNACLISLFLLRGVCLSAMDYWGESVIKLIGAVEKNPSNDAVVITETCWSDRYEKLTCVAKIGDYIEICHTPMLRKQLYDIKTSDKSVHGEGFLCYMHEDDSYGTPYLYVSGDGALKNGSCVKDIVLNRLGNKKKLSGKALQFQNDENFEYLKLLFRKLFP